MKFCSLNIKSIIQIKKMYIELKDRKNIVLMNSV